MRGDRAPDVGGNAGGAGALVFAEFAHHVRRQGQVDVRAHLGGDLRNALFVLRVGIGMQQAHGDALDAIRRQGRERGAHRGLVERGHDRAAMVDALDDAAAQVAWHQRPRRPPVNVVDVRLARGPPDFENVAKTFGGDQADAGLLALDEQVGHVGAGVDEATDCLQRHAGEFDDPLHPFDDADTEVLRGARHLERDQAPFPGQHQVGMGATGVDADGNRGPGGVRGGVVRLCRHGGGLSGQKRPRR